MTVTDEGDKLQTTVLVDGRWIAFMFDRDNF